MKKIILFILCWAFAVAAKAQQITLRIGDSVPPLAYGKWLKGTPMEGFKKDRVYVLEFWATWCVPCIAAMPHLSELAKNYKTTTTFIGVNVLESAHGKNKPYPELLAGVERFVNGIGDRMSYNVIADNEAQDMDHKWLAASGISFIPATFVVKNGRMAWEGDPMELDTILPQIINGSFDSAAFKKQYEEKSTADDKQMEPTMAAMKAMQEAVMAKNYTKALQLIDSNIPKMPALRSGLEFEKFKILLEQSRDTDAITCAKVLCREDSSFCNKIGGAICDKDALHKSTYLFAAGIFVKSLENKKACLIYDKLALSYYKAGDLPAAIKTEEQAVEQAKIDVKDPAMAGFVFDYTITDFQKKIDTYKSELK